VGLRSAPPTVWRSLDGCSSHSCGTALGPYPLGPAVLEARPTQYPVVQAKLELLQV
jgi:hypothetical protein